MCGILGLVTPDQNQERMPEACIDSLKNRGFDGTGSYKKGVVAFYHTRLAVIDRRETSNQPLLSDDGNCAVVCNGEIYNHDELRGQYQYNYRTTSDSEVILACYLSEGIEGFKQLKGTFSFGLFDHSKGKVLVYRDAVGKKPIFYSQDQKRFVFASSVQAVRDNLKLSLSTQTDALACYLKEGCVPPDRTIYKSVTPVMPGELIQVDAATGKMSKQKLYPESSSYKGFDYTQETIFQEANRLLDQSVARRVQGLDHPVLLLSGGIDSTVLASKMSGLLGEKMTCVGLRPLVPGTNDDLYARYAARKLQLQYRPVGFCWKELEQHLNHSIALLDQPFSIPSYYWLTALTLEARKFGNVLLSGEGGDEAFYGYSRIDDWFSEDDGSMPPYTVGPPQIEKLSEWGRWQVTKNLLEHAFVKLDKATAEQQMEARCPYLSWDLLVFMRSIPGSLFVDSGVTKHLLKRMLNGFPGWFLHRKKGGSAFNFRWLLFPLYEKMYHEIDWKRLSGLGLPVTRFPFSRSLIFRRFDQFWKLYVLNKFVSSGRL